MLTMATNANNGNAIRSVVLSDPSLEHAYKACLSMPGDSREHRWLLSILMTSALSTWVLGFNLLYKLFELHSVCTFDIAYWINVAFLYLYGHIAYKVAVWIENKPSHRIKFAKPCMCASLVVMLISLGFMSASIIKPIF